MNINTKKLLTLLLSGACFQACTKKDDAPKITTQTLTGTYTLTALTSNDANGSVTNLYVTLDPCQQDDQVRLNGDGTYNDIDAGTKCTPPGDSEGTWSLAKNNKMIIDGDTASIIAFDSKQLVISVTQDPGGSGSGVPVSVTETLTKK